MTLRERYGPWAVIAGASEGTGQAFARRLAMDGVNCILIARREGPLDVLAEEIRAETGVQCITASIDLSAPDAADRIIAVAGDREVGLFINNAGADVEAAAFLSRDVEAWAKLANMNVTTPMRCCHHFGGLMKARGRGGLMIVNSGACYAGIAGVAVYGGVKAFELVFAEGLWAELKPRGVDVLTLVLLSTDTPAYRKLLAERGRAAPAEMAAPADVAEVGLAQLPHGPIYNWGQANDVAGFIAPNSPDARRARIVAMSELSRSLMAGLDD